MESESGLSSSIDSAIESYHSEGESGGASPAISSDTLGSAPGTPRSEEDYQEHITSCMWDGCREDLHSLDLLVRHIHDVHIGNRKQKYTCEWDECPRKGIPQTSRFALVAHIRSHTGEKPFFCTVPECDRAFTRSDALAKHMRTVHETEALRPSDPVPKSHPSHPHNVAAAATADANARAAQEGKDAVGEKDRRPDDTSLTTVRALERKLKWAREHNKELAVTLDYFEQERKRNLVKKELLLERVLKQELGDRDAQEILR